jgi:cytochrome c5
MRAHVAAIVLLVAVLAGAACGGASEAPPPEIAAEDAGAPEASAPGFPEIVLDHEPQRDGDPAKGYRALVNEPYVPCGVPWSAYAQVLGEAPDGDRIPGREGRNEVLPYNLTAMTTEQGVELVTSNCLTCHAGRINGELVVGLGAADGDFTRDPSVYAAGVGLLLSDPDERAEWMKWKERVETIAPYSILSTRGPNPADSFTAVLFAHHDADTLAWSSSPLMSVPPPEDVPVDVPPWWRMKKKSSMFYVGAGRGDHARIMMTASILCTSSVEESEAIDSYFADIRAYIASIEPPKYPFAVDGAQAVKGQLVFERTCSRCHGRYGADEAYPNRLITLEEIGTDPVLVTSNTQYAGPFGEWFGRSFFGQMSRLEPQNGYVAPPLDGIWATAPFLHNGSVPNLEALLDSTKRPTYWTRTFDSTDYDAVAVGFRHTALPHGKAGEPSESKRAAIYDTTRPGYSNAGHTFGDDLTSEERALVLEYLKTL